MMKQWAFVILIFVWLGWHLAVPVNFIGSDLGRHIKNGELVVQGQWDVLYKNYYSYTNPEYPFINHHWLFGVFCFVCWHYLGFTGLSLVYLILELLAFYVFLRCARRYSSWLTAGAFSLWSIPFISMRSEIRPEGFSYLFCGIFWWMMDSFQRKRLKQHHLMIGLCVLQIIWVNMHIFFIMGPILTALFWWQAHSNGEKQQAGVLQKLFCFLIGMCLINPAGINGFFAPFHVDRAYSYVIEENRPIGDLLNSRINPDKSIYLYFLAASGMLIAVLIFLIRQEGVKRYVFAGTLTLLLSIAVFKAERMIGLYGFLWIPLSSWVYSRWMNAGAGRFRKNIEIALLLAGILFSLTVNFDWEQKHGLGITPGANDAAEFFKREKISGNIFNNYTIGGYLIFHLSPEHKLFVDNRMEAFPEDFFKQIYVPMQLRDDLWQEMDRRYHFNAIFYCPEFTPWGEHFIRDRYKDPSWALVYSRQAVIFLKRNKQNADIIRRWGIQVQIIDLPAKG